MLTLPDHFRVLLSNIEPDEQRLKLAQEIPAQVREFLKASQKILSVPPHSRLVGSYARHTAINNIKDVDVILLVDSTYHNLPAKDVLDATFSALHDLPKYLNDPDGEVTVRRRQRRSVNVTLKQADFCLDIVPAVALDDLSEPLQIPDREWSKWVETHPLGYSNSLSTLNQSHSEKVIPLIKLFKLWRDVNMIRRRPKSYWLECLIYHHITSGNIKIDGKSYAELFCELLAAVLDAFASCYEKGSGIPEIADPMLGHNVAHNWERPDFETFMRKITESHKWASQALESDSEEGAIALWQKVFGSEKFPSTSVVKGMLLQWGLATGSVSVTRSDGRVLLERPNEPSVQVPKQRFYGDES